jgi:hypothetical protein
MKLRSSVIRQIGRRLKAPDESIRDKFYVFLICLAISVLMWFMIILSRDSVYSIEYTLKFTNPPEGMALRNAPDSVITFRISKGGLEMIALKYFSGKKYLEVDLSSLDLRPQGRFFSSSFLTSRLASSLHRRFRFSEELISISPEEIYFRFELLSGKMVPVVPNTNLTFQKLFKQAGSIRSIPDSVKVVAPGEVLNNISYIETLPVSLKDIAGEVRIEAILKIPDPAEKVQLFPPAVELIVTAEKFTEITIPLLIESESGSYRLKTFPEKVEVTFWISLSDYSRIDDVMFRAVADISWSTDRNIATVRLESVPSFVEVIKIEPQKVEFLLLGHD